MSECGPFPQTPLESKQILAQAAPDPSPFIPNWNLNKIKQILTQTAPDQFSSISNKT